MFINSGLSGAPFGTPVTDEYGHEDSAKQMAWGEYVFSAGPGQVR